MAISVVQSPQAAVSGGSGTGSISFASLPAVGNSVIVVLGQCSSGGVSSVADNQTGNTYSTAIQQVDFQNTGNSAAVTILQCKSITTPSGTFTVSWSFNNGTNAGFCGAFMLEVSGLGSLDQTGGNNNGGNLTTGPLVINGSAQNNNANALVVGIAVMRSGANGSGNPFSAAPTSGYGSGLAVYNPGTQGPASTGGYKIVSALETSQMTTPTWTGAANCVGALATFGQFQSPPIGGIVCITA